MAPTSLGARVALSLAVCAALAASVTAIALRWLAPEQAALGGFAIALPLCIWLARRLTLPWIRVVRAVRDRKSVV